MEYTNLTILAAELSERRAIFARVCELLSLDQEKEAQKQKIERKREGFDVSMNNLIVLCFLHGLHGGFDFRTENKTFSILDIPSVQSEGAVAVNAPETIKNTVVDEVAPEPKAQGTEAGAGTLPGATMDSAFESVGNDSAPAEPTPATEEEPEEEEDYPF